MNRIKIKDEEDFYFYEDVKKIIKAFMQEYEDVYISEDTAKRLWELYSENSMSCGWCNIDNYSLDEIIEVLEEYYEIVEE